MTAAAVSGDQLVLRARDGCPEAVQALLEQFEPLVAAASRKLRVPHLDRADLQQEARLALCRALGRFQPERGSWPALAQVAVRHHLQNLLAHATAGSRAGSGLLSLEALLETGDGREPEAELQVEEEAVARLHARSVNQAAFALTPDPIDRALLAAIQDGRSVASLAPSLGLTPQGATKRQRRLMARLRSALTAAGYSA